MRFGGLICLGRVAGSMMMTTKNVHQRTGEEKQVGCSGERVARMRDQQVSAERCRSNSRSQAKPGAEKTGERVHGHPRRQSLSISSSGRGTHGARVALRQMNRE